MSQGWFESDDSYRERTAREADERTIEDSTGSAPSQGWFESDDSYRCRIAQEANEHRIEDSSGEAPSQGWFESDDSYRDRIAQEANKRTIEDSTGSAPKQGWLESDDAYDVRIRTEANEHIIESDGGSAPKQGRFESNHDYRSRIAHEAREIRARQRPNSSAEADNSSRQDSDPSSYSSGSNSEQSSSGASGCIRFVVVVVFVALGIAAITGGSDTPKRTPTESTSSAPQTVYGQPTAPSNPVPTYYNPLVVAHPPVAHAPTTPSTQAYPTFPTSPPQPVSELTHRQIMAGDMLYVVNVAQDDPDQLNVRAGPGQRFKSVGYVPWNGVRIEYLGRYARNENDLWFYVRWGDVVGWVHTSHLHPEQ